ncbi:MAG: PLP-dependent aminotransferase family protein [Alphaproteobacteria bacterium]|nr:PLP-dependent aminotransferase family protein [Alphaproteobacteria bacterium]
MSETTLYNYEKLANFITNLIDDGVYVKGARIPSLRQICKQHKLSLSTAMQAYHLLEDKGILESRVKSGFYVANRPSNTLATPTTKSTNNQATLVNNSDIFLEMLEHSSNLDFAPLGCAIPSADIMAAGKLNKAIARAARVNGAQHNIYTVPKGDLGLRKQIARQSLKWGQNISPEDIVITCGCTEALSVALKTITKIGDTIAVECPTYFGQLQLLKALGLKVLEIPTDAHNGIDTAALETALNSKKISACLFSSSINNPLGMTMSDAKKLQILALLNQYDVPLIEDDIMGDLYFGETRPKPFIAFENSDNVIYCSSFSKTIAPGYRIGWIVTKQHMPQIMDNKLATSLSSPTLTQVAMADYLSSSGYENQLRRIRRIFANNVDRMTRAIEQYFPAGTRVSRPSGGFLLWLELPYQIDGKALFKQALDKGICFAPGTVFSPNPEVDNRFANCMRLSCGHEWNEQIDKAIQTLGKMAADAKNP